VTEIAPGVFVHRGVHELATPENLADIANVGFVLGDEAVAVIDTGGCARAGARLHASVRQVTARPIRFVIASHMPQACLPWVPIPKPAGAGVFERMARDCVFAAVRIVACVALIS
jgi:hypothetical protein